MRVRIDVEVDANEAASAERLLAVLRDLAQCVRDSSAVSVASASAPSITAASSSTTTTTSSSPAAAAAAAAAGATVPAASALLVLELRRTLDAAVQALTVESAVVAGSSFAACAAGGGSSVSSPSVLAATLWRAVLALGAAAAGELLADVLHQPFLLAAPTAMQTRAEVPCVRFLVAMTAASSAPPTVSGVRAAACDALLKRLMDVVCMERMPSNERAPFFAETHAITLLVCAGLVQPATVLAFVPGMLRAPGKRAAGLTLMGVLVHGTGEQLRAPSTSALLQEVLDCLPGIGEPHFAIDCDFLGKRLTPLVHATGVAALAGATLSGHEPVAHAGKAASAGAVGKASGSSASPTAAVATLSPSLASLTVSEASTRRSLMERPLALVGSLEGGHTRSVLAVARDADGSADGAGSLLSAGRDGVLACWRGGKLDHAVTIDERYPCGVSLLNGLGVCVLACNHPTGGAPALVVCARGERPHSKWAVSSTTPLAESKLISVVQMLDVSAPRCVAGVAMAGATPTYELQLFDVERGGSSSQRVQRFTEHRDFVSAVCSVPSSVHEFVSGSKDCTIKLWDARQSASVGALARKSFLGPTLPHDGMVSALDSAGHYVVSGSMDKTVHVWDLRTVSSAGSVPVVAADVAGAAVMKAVFAGTPDLVVVSALNHLAALSVRDGKVVTTPSSETCRYHDCTWDSGARALYAVGTAPRVDVFA